MVKASKGTRKRDNAEESMRENSLAIYVARGASSLFIQNIASTIILITAFALIARLVSQAEMGILATLTLIAGACQLIANLGLPSAATKFISEHTGKDDRQTASSVFYQILRVSLTTLKEKGLAT